MPKPIASIDRPLTLRLRPDLIAVEVETAGARTWLLKDLMTLEHFQFTAEEYALVDWLRQPLSIAELQRRFGREFGPQQITAEAVWQFLSRLHQAGLLMSDGTGQGRELLDRMRNERSRRWAMVWTSLLAIRFRGFDPDALLTAAHRRLGWLFSPAALVFGFLVLAYAGSLVVGHFGEFQRRLPDASALFDARNAVWLLLTIGAVKVLHELGHAIACKHFGGEVRELGFMLLVLAPCLYCDVSDAWRLKSKWQRIAISAAGMVVEIMIAAVATIVWWHAQPGLVQLLALNTIVICTLGTLLINGNPLLRYDGYYILSDLTETPNLWQRSREVLRRAASGWLFGDARTDDPLLPASQWPWLALYALASKCYVALVCVAIVWGLVELLYPLHLENIAYLIGLTVVGGMLVAPVTGAVRLARDPMRRAELRRGRLALVTSIALGAAVALLAMPVNYYVRAPLVLMPDNAARVFATIDGTLTSTLPAGSNVVRGNVLGQLKNVEAERELARIQGEYALRKMRVEHLERLRGVDSGASSQLPAARAALVDSKRRMEDRRHEVEGLTLKSPADGVVLAPPATQEQSAGAGRLSTWSGTLLEPRNAGAYIEPGTLICLVGDPRQMSAILLVDDRDVKRLAPGQAVRMRIDELPGQVLEGEVVDVARYQVRGDENAKAAQADLSGLFAGLVAPERTKSLYQARVQFDSPGQPLVIGGRGHAKVTAERITLARSIVRYIGQTFRLPM
jgi:putative peptide zinc metalloprotease protein